MTRGLWLGQVVVAFVALGGFVAWIGDGGGAFLLRDNPVLADRGPSRADGANRKGYPRRWTDQHGYPLVLESAPESVASRVLAVDHLLFEVLPESQIAGVSEYAHMRAYSNVHSQVRSLGVPIVLNVEALLAINPSLLLASEISSPDFLRMARSTTVPVFSMRTLLTDRQDIESAMALIGDLGGQESRASAAIGRFNAAWQALVGRVPDGAARSRVLGLSS